MKLLIIEGQDNLGKTTLIHNLIKKYKSVVIRKFDSPPSHLNMQEKQLWQEKNFRSEFILYNHLTNNNITNSNDNIMIWDRSHLGEQVYGTMYRNNDPQKWLYKLEHQFDVENDNNIHLLLLEGSLNFLMDGINDDGLSLTLKLDQFINFFKETYPLFNYGQFGHKYLSDLDSETCKTFLLSTIDNHIERTFIDHNTPDGELYQSLAELYDALDILTEENLLGSNYNRMVKRLEKILFEYAFNRSLSPNKLRLSVDINNEFRSTSEITEEVQNFLQNKN